MHLIADPWDERWISFAASMPQANIFYQPAWMQVMAECYAYRPFVIAVQDAEGKITAGLPVMEVSSRWTGRRWVSLPFTDHCAPLFSDAGALHELIEGLIGLATERKIPRIELRWAPRTRTDLSEHSNHVLHVVELGSDLKFVDGRVHPMHRRNIEVARKRGVRIEWGRTRDALDKFYQLHLTTRRRQGMPIQPRRFFDVLGRIMIDGGLGFVLTAYQDDECLAAAIFLHWQQTLTYKYGASSEQGLSLRPNNLLFWTAIEWGCQHGYTMLDLGRTDLDNTGLRQFKSRWGAEERLLTYADFPAHPSQSATGKLMALMQTTIRHSPPWVCRMVGELIYEHFG